MPAGAQPASWGFETSSVALRGVSFQYAVTISFAGARARDTTNFHRIVHADARWVTQPGSRDREHASLVFVVIAKVLSSKPMGSICVVAGDDWGTID
jgi:hypothetical protein